MRYLMLLALLTVPPLLPAATAEEKGLAIAMEMDERDKGWVDQQASLVMVLRNKQGQESTRRIRVRSLEVEADGDKSLTISDSPADVKGTAQSGYTRQVVWVDTQIWQALKVEYYDRKDALLKTLLVSNFQQYLEHHWRADAMSMVNHQTGKSTELQWSDYVHRVGLSKRDFDRNALKRAR